MRDSECDFTRDVARYDAWYHTPWGAYAEAEELRLLLEMARPEAGEDALEVGCGTGRMLLRMLARDVDALGVEPAPDMRNAAQWRLDQHGHRAGRVVSGSVDALPFEDGAFDLVWAITVLEFVDDVSVALREMARVCGGRLFLGALNARSVYGAGIRRGEAGETLSRANLQTPSGLVQMVQEHAGPRRIDVRTTLVGGATDDPLELAVQKGLDRRLRSRWCALGGFIALIAEV
jgi:SAM-dependent methyltransferase